MKKTIISIEIAIAFLFVAGADWAGDTAHRLFQSYFADVFIPFGFYLLLILSEDNHPSLQKWYTKAGAVFALCALSETLQYFGIFALARVFDPVDYAMYAVGVLLATCLDTIILKHMRV